jgi:hypothetical protein
MHKKESNFFKNYFKPRHQYLTPVILATGGRTQEDHGLKPAPGKQFVRPYLEKPYLSHSLTHTYIQTDRHTHTHTHTHTERLA